MLRAIPVGRISTAVVQRFCKPKVGGSIPSSGTILSNDCAAVLADPHVAPCRRYAEAKALIRNSSKLHAAAGRDNGTRQGRAFRRLSGGTSGCVRGLSERRESELGGKMVAARSQAVPSRSGLALPFSPPSGSPLELICSTGLSRHRDYGQPGRPCWKRMRLIGGIR